jgi:hypothetical protein
MPTSSMWSLSFRLLHQTLYTNVCVCVWCHTPFPPHLTSLYHPNNISCTVQIEKHFIMQVSCPVTSSILDPNTPLTTPDSYQVFIYIPTKYAKYWQIMLHILNLKWLTYWCVHLNSLLTHMCCVLLLLVQAWYLFLNHTVSFFNL